MATPGSEVYLIRREVYQRVLATFEKNGIEFARPKVLVAGSGPDLDASNSFAAAAATAVRTPNAREEAAALKRPLKGPLA